MGTIVIVQHDTSDLEALDAAFAAKREAEAYATRATARGILVKRVGLASILAGVGIGCAAFGISFLLQPRERIVIQEKLVTLPGAVTERIIEKQVPGPTVYVTETEKRFIDSPGYASATVKGKIVKSVDGIALTFDSGKSWSPVDRNMVSDSDPFIGDWGYCEPAGDHWHCFASHNGVTVSVPQKKAQRS